MCFFPASGLVAARRRDGRLTLKTSQSQDSKVGPTAEYL